MSQRKLFLYLAAASGYIGIGLVLGYVLSDQVSNTPLWIGGLLVLLGAVLIGMFISSRNTPLKNENDRPVTTPGSLSETTTDTKRQS